MNALIGIWLYSSLIYHGQPMALPNPALKMYFTFESNSTNEIFYYREGEPGSCKRKATYAVKDDELTQTVVSVDENNADFCSQDQDMQVGHVSITKFSVTDDKFYLVLPLGEETLTYVWSKTTQDNSK